MHKKAILLGLASTLLLLSMFGATFTTPVVADPKTIRVPEDYPTIQAAVDAADPGDTIQVASGTYYENVKVGKSVKLVGVGSEPTIIDGNGTDSVVYVTANNVEISCFIIRNGMLLGGGIGGFFPGIYFYQSNGSTVSCNVLSHNYVGISVSGSDNILVSGNVVTDNQYGIRLTSSSGNIIVDNVVTQNWLYGIYLFASDENTIVGNQISYNRMTDSTYGICLGPSSDTNILYHNNVVNNTNQAYENQTNTWDNGAEGNYWSDYAGEDLNGDGVGDTLLPHQGVDYYPLVEPWRPIRVFDGVTIFSNSTIASFNFSLPLMQVSFNVTGPPGTSGFCNITIPINLLSGVFMVRIDGAPIDYILTRNATHVSIYFNYSHGIHKVEIFDIYGVLKKAWFTVVGGPRYDERADLNKDGLVNIIDVIILGKDWYKV